MTVTTRFPMRRCESVVPLITASEGFPALERGAAEARETIWMAFRIFDPTTPLREMTEFGTTWSDLLAARLSDGVEIRVILSDFDPIAVPERHESTWRSVRALEALAPLGRLEVLVSRHEGRAGRGLRLGLWPMALASLERQRRALAAMAPERRATAYAARPGIWRYLRFNASGRVVWRFPRLPRLYPVTHHQKLAVFDGRCAVIGGLDVNERRYDGPEHDRPAEETWHDVSLSVEGALASDIARHFVDCWNLNRSHARAIAREWERHRPEGTPLVPQAHDPMPPPPIDPETAATGGGRLLRTLSVHHRRRWLRIAPQRLHCEIEEAHLALFEKARDLVYVETQFFRSTPIADGLVAAAKRAPDLGLIMVLPAAPEDVAFDDQQGPAQRLAEHLQARCVARVVEAFGERACFVSPVRPVARRSEGRETLAGSGIIYVHSKLAVVDDREAIVSSANLNGRSMRWDTEAGILMTEPARVEALRRRLWQVWLGPEVSPALMAPRHAVPAWNALAAANRSRPPTERQGFLVPYNIVPARRLGMPLPLIPEEFV